MGLVIINPSILFNRINELAWYKRTHRQWFDEIALKEKSRVLEIGCATGILTKYIADSGHIPLGLDSSSKMINLARKNHAKINFVEASALDLPIENETYNSVITASLLNIILNKSLLLNEIFRVLVSGEIVSVLVPSKGFSDKDLN